MTQRTKSSIFFPLRTNTESFRRGDISRKIKQSMVLHDEIVFDPVLTLLEGYGIRAAVELYKSGEAKKVCELYGVEYLPL